MELSEMITKAKELEGERLALDRLSKAVKVEEDSLKAQIIVRMQEMGVTEWGGRATISEKPKPYISNFAELETYIREHGALDLLQKRLTESAVKLRWEDGIHIPGVGVMTEQKLQLK